MKVVGIDLSSFTVAFGIISDGEIVSAEVFANKREDFEARFDQLTDKTQKLFSAINPDVVYIEAIPYVQSPRTALTLASVLGMVRALCRLKEIPYFVVHNLTWKKGIGLKGKVTKQDTENLMREMYAINVRLSENQYDALGVATYGLSIHPLYGDTDPSSLSFAGTIQIEQEPAETTPKAPVRRKSQVDKASGKSTQKTTA